MSDTDDRKLTVSSLHGIESGDRVVIYGEHFRVTETDGATSFSLRRLRWYERAYLAIRSALVGAWRYVTGPLTSSS